MKFKEVIKAVWNALKEEKEEIGNLIITDEDKKQAAVILNAIAAVLASQGVPTTVTQNEYTKKVLEYAIRDMKDGLHTPSNLIAMRIINNIKKEKEK